MNTDCPGRYCGVFKSSDRAIRNLSCSACPLGYRTNSAKFCVKCTDDPRLYEWMYLGFMFTLPLFLNWLYIGIYLQKYKFSLIRHCVSALVETATSIIISLLLFEPRGTFSLISCRVIYLSDWYTIFYNPTVMYSKTLYCAQEAVYPLYSIVFVCLLFSLLLMLIFRPFFTYNLCKEVTEKKQNKKVFYAAMYFHPIIVVAHASLAGLVYYSYPYIIILIALFSSTFYIVAFDLLYFPNLFRGNWIRHWLIILWQFVMLSYALLAILNAYLPLNSNSTNSDSLPYLVLVIFPFVFLMATEKLTYPEGIELQIA